MSRLSSLLVACILLELGAGSCTGANAEQRLLDACQAGDLQQVGVALAAGARIDSTSNGSTPLIISIIYSHADVTRYLLDHGASPSLAIQDVGSPLHFAALSGEPELTQRLIDMGASVADRSAPHEMTPLHYAASLGQVRAIRCLLEHGADRKALDDNGRTPADVALARGYSDAACLIEN